jgi:hypothetical protein
LGQRHFHCERVGGTRRQPVSRFALQNAKRVETLESLSKRLLTTDPIVHAARGEWSQALEHWEEARVAIARVEHNLTEVRREKIRAAMTAQVDGAKESTRRRKPSPTRKSHSARSAVCSLASK